MNTKLLLLFTAGVCAAGCEVQELEDQQLAETEDAVVAVHPCDVPTGATATKIRDCMNSLLGSDMYGVSYAIETPDGQIIEENLGSFSGDTPILWAGSVSKPVVAAALMRLIELNPSVFGSLGVPNQGLDKRVCELPSMSDFCASHIESWPNPDFEEKGQIRVRHLLTHTSGLISEVNRNFRQYVGDLTFPERPLPDCGRWIGSPGLTDECVWVSRSTPAVPPNLRGWQKGRDVGVWNMGAYVMQLPLEHYNEGVSYNYSNFNFSLMARIIEAVTGQSYNKAVRDLVFIPTGMCNSFIAARPRAGFERHGDAVDPELLERIADVQVVADLDPGMRLPPELALPPPPANGLRGDYYDNLDFAGFKLSRLDSTIDFDWGTGSPDPSIGVDTYSVRWTGKIRPQFTETHTFYTLTDDGVRLWVNGQLLINNWTDHPPTENSGSIALTAGVAYDIRLEYFEGGVGSVVRLSWSSPSTPKQIIPAVRFLEHNDDLAWDNQRRQWLNFWPEGGVMATAHDMRLFYRMIKRNGIANGGSDASGCRENFPDHQVLGARAIEEMKADLISNHTAGFRVIDGFDAMLPGLAPGSLVHLGRPMTFAWVDPQGLIGVFGSQRLTDLFLPKFWEPALFRGHKEITKFVELVSQLGEPVSTTGLALHFDAMKAIHPPAVDRLSALHVRVPPANGLLGDYFDNANLTGHRVSRFDNFVDFDWGLGSPDPSIGSDTFSVRWTGLVRPQFTQTYTFYTVSDDGVRLWVDGQLLIDNWTDHGPTENSGTIALVAGRNYDLRMEYYESGVGALARLSWSSPSQPKQVIPASRLFPRYSLDTDAPVCFPGEGYSTWYDLSARQLPGYIQSGRSCSDLWRGRGVPTDPYRLSLQGDRVDAFDGEGRSAYTISAWVRPTALGNVSIVTRTNGGAEYSHAIWMTDAGDGTYRFQHYAWDGRPLSIVGSTRVLPGRWYHVAVAADSYGRMELYVDGAIEASFTGTGALWTGGDRYMFGGVVPGRRAANVELAWVRVHDHRRSAADIAGELGSTRRRFESGLRGDYYDNINFTQLAASRWDATIDFNWPGAPDPAVGPDTFSVRWTGKVQPRYSERYTFTTTSDDGVRLWVNNQLVIENWTDHAPTQNSGAIDLVAGVKYDIRMDFYESGGGATARLHWSSATQPSEVVPASRLFPR